MEISVIPVSNTSLWALVVDGEVWREGTYEEVDDRARELRCAVDAFGKDLENEFEDDADEIDLGYGCDRTGFCQGPNCPQFFSCPDAC